MSYNAGAMQFTCSVTDLILLPPANVYTMMNVSFALFDRHIPLEIATRRRAFPPEPQAVIGASPQAYTGPLLT